MSKRVDAATMTTEAASKEGKPEPAFRKPNQTRAGRQRQEMVAGYIAALGGADRISPIQMADIERAADLVMLAQTVRAALAAGVKVTINDLVKLEGAADRAVRRLNLPPNAAAPVMGLHDIVARRAAERANPPTEGSD
jgi:hypothetical protein